MIAYIYINEKEKHFSLKLSDEIRDIKILTGISFLCVFNVFNRRRKKT